MANIILSSYGTIGDALPFARVGRALLKRGHQVTLLSNHPHRKIAEDHGIDFGPLDDAEEFRSFIEDGLLSNTMQGQVALYRKHFLPRVRAEYELIRSHQDREQTIIVARATPTVAALLASEKLGFPVIPVFLAPSFHQSMFLVEEMFRSVLFDEINCLRSQVGLTAISDWRSWFNSRKKGIGFWPGWFADVDKCWPEIISTGFIVPDRDETAAFSTLPPDAQQLLRSGQPPIIISGGTGLFAGREWYEACVKACEMIGQPAIISTAHESQVPQLGEKMVWCGQLPFETVFPHARAIIHHGGIGTVGQALHSGIPQLILGSGSDRPDNARQLIRLGVGDYLPPSQWTPDLIAQKLLGLFTNGAMEKSRALAAKQTPQRGIEAVCDEIERCLLKEANASSNPTTVGACAEKAFARKDSVARLMAQLSPAKRALLEQRLNHGKNPSKKSEKISPAVRSDGENVFPVSFSQEQLWLLEQLYPGNRAYVSASAVEIEGPLDSAILEAALNEMIRRHETLRTTFDYRQGRAVQVVHPFTLQKIEHLDAGLMDGISEEKVRKELALIQNRIFDLKVGPVFRVTMVMAGKQRHYVLLNVHHIVVDGWSMGLFCQELSSLYASLLKKSLSDLPSLPAQYADYAVWQRSWLEGERLEQLVRYWKTQMEGFSLPRLPQNPLQAEDHQPSSRSRSIRINSTISSALKQFGHEEGMTFFMTTLAAFKLVMHWHSGWKDLTVGTDVANRNHPETQRLIGFFVNQLVLRSKISAEWSLRTFLNQVRETCRQAYAHQDLPFGKLVAMLNPNREFALSPLFHFKFVLQNVPTQTGFQLAGCTCKPFGVTVSEAKFPLLINLWDNGKELAGSFDYSPAYFSDDRIRILTVLFEAVLTLITKTPDVSLSAVHEHLTALELTMKERAIEEMQANHRKRFHHATRQPVNALP